MIRLFSDKTEKEITELYISGFQQKQLAVRYNCSHHTIFNVLRRQNCKIRGHFGVHNRNNGGICYDNGYKRLFLVKGKTAICEHRFVIEQHLGRKLQRREVVHHINEKRDDNRLENLQLMTIGEHGKLHKGRKHNANLSG